jgi:hypothetical protein
MNFLNLPKKRHLLRCCNYFSLFILIGLFSFRPPGAKPPVDLVVSAPTCFTALDGSASDEDGTADGTLTVSSLTITNTGSILYNDPGNICSDAGVPNDGAGSIKIVVSGDVSIAGTISTENTIQSGKAGDITLTVGGAFSMVSGGLITSSNLTATSGDRSAGKITIDVVGNVDVPTGATIKANSQNGNGGDIAITSGNNMDIDGSVLSQSLSGQSGSGNNQAHGGYISLKAAVNLVISNTGIVSSRGGDPGADLVHLCACNVTIYGLVESTGAGHAIPSNPPNHLDNSFRPDKPSNSTAGIEVWACNSLIIDATNGHNGQLNADLCCGGGTSGTSWIDLFVQKGDVNIVGGNTTFAVHANGKAGNTDNGGTITIKALEGAVIASGKAVQADGTYSGGTITVQAKKDVDLSNGTLYARGYLVLNTIGGTINVRSFGVGPAPGTGSILSNAATVLNVSGGIPGQPPSGHVNLSECSNTPFAGTIIPALVITPEATGVCGGAPDLASQPYVEFCCCCTGTITITKILFGTAPAADWLYHSNIPGVGDFTLPAAGGSIIFTGIPNGSYTVTEVNQESPECPDQHLTYRVSNTCQASVNDTLVATINIVNCDQLTCTFTNRAPNCQTDVCQWCNKSAVLSQVWQNPGGGDQTKSCIVPDILVDVRLPHGGANDVVDPSEIGTGVPATWSIQAAVDYVNANGDPSPIASPGEIFIGVTATDGIPVNPGDATSCGRDCARPLAGDGDPGVENVFVSNNNTARLNIFGCSVTMLPLDPTLPVFSVVNVLGKGKITILDLHVKNDALAGYFIQNYGDLVVVKNSAAWYNDIGYIVKDVGVTPGSNIGKVEITGAQHINGNRIGILLEGTNTKLRTNSDIILNTEVGIKITGTGNETNGNEIGNSGHPNPIGMLVTGSNNNLHDDNASFNTGDGIYVTGNTNTLHQERANSNGGNGIHVEGTGNKLDGNKTEKNTLHGILACGQVDNGGNVGTDNIQDPQVQFVCPSPSSAKFSVVDIDADKSYKYDGSFNLISSSPLATANADANDAAADATNTYVLDKNDKQVYRYVGTGATSRVLRQTVASGGGTLGTPTGLAITGDDMWVVDGGPRAYKYSLSAAFTGSGNVNASQQFAVTSNAEGLLVDATYIYVLNKSDKRFYRYLKSTGAAAGGSKIMKDPGGSSLGNPTGAAFDGTDIVIVDNNKDKAYRYSISGLAFATPAPSTNVNASASYALYYLNVNATGIASGSSSNLQANFNTDITRTIIPEKTSLMNVFPNPFTSQTNIRYNLATPGHVSLSIVDNFGREVAKLVDGQQAAGTYNVQWNAKSFAGGAYFVRLTSGKYSGVNKLFIVR